MACLCVVKRGRAQYLRRDRASQLRGVGRLGSLGKLLMRGARTVNSAAILRAAIRSLTISLRRVVALPEHAEQVRVRDAPRVVHHLHSLGVPGPPTAHLLVRRTHDPSADVSSRSAVDTGQSPEAFFDTPETPRGKSCRVQERLPRSAQGRAQDVVTMQRSASRQPRWWMRWYHLGRRVHVHC